MKSKIVSQYEKKRWYRGVKSFYVFVFATLLIGFNYISVFDGKFYLNDFLIGNIVIIFGMGAIEGLFWYVVNGKWGYPKDFKQEEN